MQIKQLIHSKLEITFRGKTQYIAIHPLLVKGGVAITSFPGEFYYIAIPLIRKGERWLYSQCSGEKDGYG